MKVILSFKFHNRAKRFIYSGLTRFICLVNKDNGMDLYNHFTFHQSKISSDAYSWYLFTAIFSSVFLRIKCANLTRKFIKLQ